MKEYWMKFVSWKGWKSFVSWKGWKQLISWKGWKTVLFLHPVITALLCILSAVGLTWVFTGGYDTHPLAYGLYCLSFYALVAVAVRVPRLAGKLNELKRRPKVEALLGNEDLKIKIPLYFEQVINLGYGLVKIVTGAVYASAWIGADGLYNLVQGIIQLVQVIRRKKATTAERQWRSYRLCGGLMLAMHLTMTGLVFQMIHRGEHEEYPGVMIFATAAFTFYKLIKEFVEVAKDRKHKQPVDSAIRLLDLSQAIFNLFSLQVALLWEFGGDFAYTKLMNSMTGGAVCLLIMGMGIYMLRRSRKALDALEEKKDG